METRLYLTNLPLDITETQLRCNLIRDFIEFERAAMRETLKIKLFLPRRGQSGNPVKSAIISGFKVDLESLQLRAIGKTCGGRLWRFKKDYGSRRAENGDFLRPLSGAAKRLYRMLDNLGHRKVMVVFNPQFRQTFDACFNGKAYTFIDQEGIHATQVGAIQCIDLSRQVTKLEYGCSLECLQNIVFWNSKRNPRNQVEMFFCDERGQNKASCRYHHGLGAEREMINIRELSAETGYLELNKFYEPFISLEQMQNMHSYCWNCKNSYELLGVDCNLRYVAGKCGCNYTRTDLDIMSKERGIYCGQEKFTRLGVGGQDTNGQLTWIILYDPMKACYENGAHYREIVGPILRDEWKVQAQGIKEANRCTGTLRKVNIIESFVEEKTGRRKNRTCLEIVLRETDYWTPANTFQIGKVTLEMEISSKGRVTSEKRKGNIILMRKEEGTLVVYIRIEIEEQQTIRLGFIEVTPKPIKLEYSSTLHILKGISTGAITSNFINLVLRASHPFLKEDVLPLSFALPAYRPKLMEIKIELNDLQKQARQNAVKHRLSVLQGPPGTGKTHTSGVIVMTLYAMQHGTILAVAPSNYAANQLALAIAKVSSRVNPKCNAILRMFSIKREKEYLRSGAPFQFPPNVMVLHERVQQLIAASSDDEIIEIRSKIERGMAHLLTKKEDDILSQTKQRFEEEIFNEKRVIVCTVGCLSDYRLTKWNSNTKKIRSVLVDEAANLRQPSILFPLLFDQQRVILVGDQLQLRPQVRSLSAGYAGLSLSVMEWLEISASDVPWTMLRTQYRMATSIRKVVSELSYDNLLTDGNNVDKTIEDMPSQIRSCFNPSVKSSVVVVKHTTGAQLHQGSTSYFNEAEANIAKAICDRLISGGLDSTNITILTYYEAQRKLIGSLVGELNVNVRNVDAFQGRENEVVIVSFVRGGDESVGFASFANRINVSLSRAKRLLVAIINMETFGRHRSYAVQKMLSLFRTYGDIREG